ncbi:3beta-hydroxysteroid-dehydrogenase/decarboxylase isoform 1 [Geodia barretti]|uniref:3beta-hydroxysteroid-dehydrogenase/decarboxylase isoform 1 n=1 Tax=Geodia barretti TaxID=519541 RepID=A0AA35QS58_GEOBA|nr:3beta-hydroxysteroid-dehydrogenase/decarboxylase isoform 1 [Geodia barretti]
MVCPVLERASQQKIDAPTEYPYEPLYRPWSWVLSTFGNFFIFAAIVLVGYALYRRRRRKSSKNGPEPSVSFRRVDQGKKREGRDDVLVLGAETSFGRHLVKRLLADGGYNVHCLHSYIPYQEDRLRDVCSYIQADICCYDDMLLCTREVKAVFHAGNLAPRDSFGKRVDFLHHNVKGTENVVCVCRENGVKRLVYTSSAAVVVGKDWSRRNADETAPYPKSHGNVYRASLASAEQVVLDANGKDGLSTCAMRLAPVIWSENDPLIESLLTQSMLVVDGSAHSVTAVTPEAAARAHVIADKKLQSGSDSVVGGKAYNLGDNARTSYRDLVGTLSSDDKTIWSQPPPTEISKSVMTVLAYVNYYGYKLTGTLVHNVTVSPLMMDIHTTELSFSSTRAKQDLGWEEKTEWQTAVAGLVQAHKAGREGKKEQ